MKTISSIPTSVCRLTAMALLALLCLSTLPSTAAADPVDAQACAAIMAVGGATLGYRLRASDTDRLLEGQTMTYEFVLVGGVSYVFMACGDDATRDLDIYVYDEDGYLVSQDRERDATPVVEITPRWTGSYRVRVAMYDAVGRQRAFYTLVMLHE